MGSTGVRGRWEFCLVQSELDLDRTAGQAAPPITHSNSNGTMLYKYERQASYQRKLGRSVV